MPLATKESMEVKYYILYWDQFSASATVKAAALPHFDLPPLKPSAHSAASRQANAQQRS